MPGSNWTAAALRFALAENAGGSTPIPPRAGPDTWTETVFAVSHHRVAGILAPHAEELGVPADVAEQLRGLHFANAADALLLMAQTGDVATLLADAGVRSLAIKGVCLAAVQGRQLSSRGSGDLDVWIDPADIMRAVDALVAEGSGVHPPDPTPLLRGNAWRKRLYKWVTPEMVLSYRGTDLDLHWRLLRSPSHIRLDFDTAWERSVAVAKLGHNVRTLCPTDALRHVAAHGTKDYWATLRHVTDVVYLARMIDPEELRELAKSDCLVDLALTVAAHLAPELAYIATGSRRTTRLARQSWNACLSMQMRPQFVRAQTGRTNIWLRLRILQWQVRSSPNLATALHPIIEAPISMNAVLDPAPFPIAVINDIRLRVRESRR